MDIKKLSVEYIGGFGLMRHRVGHAVIKFVAIVSLWLFFFGVLAIVHLWISVLRLPNRWKIVSRWIQGFTWSMRADYQYQSNGRGR